MPDRIVRAGIITSEPVNSLSWGAEVFYRRLFSIVDDYGRHDGRPVVLRALLYTLKIDSVSDDDIGGWLTECASVGLITVYKVKQNQYIEIPKFGQRTRANKSKWPSPDDDDCQSLDSSSLTSADICQQLSSNAPVCVVVDVVECVDGASTPAKSVKKVKRSLPEDFVISDRVTTWAKQKGHSRLTEHFEAFKSKCRANGYKYVDWDDAFMEAVRADWAKLGSTPARKAPANIRELT